LEFTLFQSPTKTRRTPEVFKEPTSLPQVLHNVGFADFDCLSGLVCAWRSILDASKPDVVIADHAPGALVALHGGSIPVALFGIGFGAPPPACPLEVFSDAVNDDSHLRAEHELLENLNRVLDANGQGSLPDVGSLFRQSASFLLTFKELDPYRTRDGADYVGAWPLSSQFLDMPD